MTIEKISVNGHYVWVDKDAEIKEDCYALHLGVLGEREIVTANGECKLDKKIIASSPELNLEGVPTYVEWLAEQFLVDVGLKVHKDLERDGWLQIGFIKGYQTAEKELPTWDDVKKAIEMAKETTNINPSDNDNMWVDEYSEEEIIEQLKQEKK